VQTFVIFIYILNFLLILSVIFIEHKKSAQSLLWVLLLVTFPVIGFLLYITLGMTFRLKMHKLLKGKKLKNPQRNLYYKQLNDIKNYDLHKNHTATEITDLIRFNFNYSSSDLTVYNEAKIMLFGEDKYKMLFSDIDNASHSVHAQYFLIHNDIISNEFIERLTKKAKEGVSIKVLYDSLANITTPYKIFKPLIKAGGEVKKLRPYLTQYRNHRKIAVIDGKIGYTGGMNMGDEYANIKKNSPFYRDTHIRLKGDAVYMLQYYFLCDWFYISHPKEEDINKKNLITYFPRHNIKNYLPCQVVACGADYECGHIKMSFLKMIYSAKRSILLQSPFFIPNDSILQAIITAASSGVKVELMLPAKVNIIIKIANNYYISRVIDYGVKVFLYNGYIHSKTLSTDGSITSIGTANIDYRSMDTDDELSVFFYDKKFTAIHESIFENDKKNCTELNYELFYKRNLLQKASEKLIRLFAPLL